MANKVIKQNESKLIVRFINTVPVVLALIIFLALGLILQLIYFCYMSGRDTLNCQRIEMKKVDCTLEKTHFLGASHYLTIDIPRVKQAVLTTTQREFISEDADNHTYVVDYHVIELKGYAKSITIAELTDIYKATEFQRKINNFLESQQESLRLSSMHYESTIIPAILGTGGFTSVLTFFYVTIIVGFDFIIIWEFDKSRERLFCKRAGLIEFLTNRAIKKEYSIAEIKSIEILNSQDPDDPESSPSYSIALVKNNDAQNFPDYIEIQERSFFSLFFSPSGLQEDFLEKQKELANNLGQFLDVEVSPKPTLTKSKRLILAGKKGEYTAFGKLEDLEEELPLIDLAKSIKWLGFTSLGIMNVKLSSVIQTAGFANVSGNSYAVIFFTFTSKPKIGIKILSHEFYTTFASGASLTTSTTPGLLDMLKKKIFRSSYPGVNPEELYRLHQQRIADIRLAEGASLPVETDIKSIAIAIDEFLVREGKV